jgi:hypothetical protein
MILQRRRKIVASRYKQRGNIVIPSPSPGGDPDFGDVIFLMSGDEAPEDSAVIPPSVGAAMNWSILVGAQPSQVDGKITSDEARFGTRSLFYKETGGASNAGWASDSQQPTGLFSFAGDFTVETDIFIRSGFNSTINILGMFTFPNRAWLWQLEGVNRRMDFLYSTNGANLVGPIAQHAWGGGTTGVPLDGWHHIAVCRAGSNWYAWLDGVQSDLGTQVSAFTMFDPANQHFVIGQSGYQEGSATVEVYNANIRITSGVARYTAPFTPPNKQHPDFF